MCCDCSAQGRTAFPNRGGRGGAFRPDYETSNLKHSSPLFSRQDTAAGVRKATSPLKIRSRTTSHSFARPGRTVGQPALNDVFLFFWSNCFFPLNGWPG